MPKIDPIELAQEIIDQYPDLIRKVLTKNTAPDETVHIIRNLIAYGINCTQLTLKPKS